MSHALPTRCIVPSAAMMRMGQLQLRAIQTIPGDSEDQRIHRGAMTYEPQEANATASKRQPCPSTCQMQPSIGALLTPGGKGRGTAKQLGQHKKSHKLGHKEHIQVPSCRTLQSATMHRGRAAQGCFMTMASTTSFAANIIDPVRVWLPRNTRLLRHFHMSFRFR